MEAFLQHIGAPGNVDAKWTFARKRTSHEILSQMPMNAPEREFFEHDLTASFPSGRFNCWGVPSGAEARFEELALGDLVLIAPSAGFNGGLRYVGVVKAKCQDHAWAASGALWPQTPGHRLFPHIFFFDCLTGFRSWQDFCRDLGWKPNWNPKGWFRRIPEWRFSAFNDPEGYLNFLETTGFSLAP